MINSSIDSINASYVIPTNRRLDVSVTGINYQEKNESDNTWSDKWTFDPKIFNGPDVLLTSDDAPIGVSANTGTLTNAPFTFWSTLITTRAQRTESYRQQLALPWANTEYHRIGYRVYDNNSWRDWKYFPDENWINTKLDTKLNNTASHRYWENGTAGVQWQSRFKDAIVVVYFGLNQEVRVQFHIYLEMCESNYRYLIDGGYKSSTDNHLVRIGYSTWGVRLMEWYYNGTNIANNQDSWCPIHVYERF